MDIKEALKMGANKLKSDSRFLDAEILLAHILKKEREFLITHDDKKITPSQEKKYRALIARRAKHEPIAYITGHKEFYGLDFLVSPSTLIPRPDTELMIDLAKNTIGYRVSNSKNIAKNAEKDILKTIGCLAPNSFKIIDVGVGSGAIAITLKRLFPKIKVYGTEVSLGALTQARKNAKRLKAEVIFKKDDLLSGQGLALPMAKNLIIIANLPYLSTGQWQQLMPDVKRYEPKSALVGGKNGWELYEKLFKQLTNSLSPLSKGGSKRGSAKKCATLDVAHNITLFIEIDHSQKKIIGELAKKILNPQKIEFYKDLGKKWRVVKITIKK